MRSRLSLIAAVAKNGVIGRDGDLPWRLPDDLRHFRKTTTGKTIVMGRKTWDSLGRALPKRRNLVVSRDPCVHAPGAEVFASFDAALAASADDAEVVVIGGASLYAVALPSVDRMYLTWVDAVVAGDVFFPAFDHTAWREVEAHEHAADAEHAHAFRIVTLERV